MAKFKIGDKVRVLDGSDIKGYLGTWVTGMYDYVGREYCIDRIVERGDRTGYYITNERYNYIFDERGLELVDDKETETPRIKIYAEGDKVIAEDINSGRAETLTYIPGDQASFMDAARLALVKLSQPRCVCKFKVGDHIIGNAFATQRYGYTQEGWIGIVTETGKDVGLFRAVDVCDHDARFTLNDAYFDLFEGVVPGDKALLVDVNCYCTKDQIENVCELTDKKEYLARFTYFERCSPPDLSLKFVFDVLAANGKYALISSGDNEAAFLVEQSGLRKL